jgi:hypothetical protein
VRGRSPSWTRTDPRTHRRQVFVCGHSRRAVPCGPDGEGFVITSPKQWVKKLAPLIKITITLMKVALAVGGLPCVALPQMPEMIPEGMLDGAADAMRR